jgi:aminoglycoside phosphotransferase (APT) family kinase protein
LKNRPNQFQHDDFHLKNIIVQDKHYVGVIDFNGYDWGDPLHDLVKVALFSREVSILIPRGKFSGILIIKSSKIFGYYILSTCNDYIQKVQIYRSRSIYKL